LEPAPWLFEIQSFFCDHCDNGIFDKKNINHFAKMLGSIL